LITYYGGQLLACLCIISALVTDLAIRLSLDQSPMDGSVELAEKVGRWEASIASETVRSLGFGKLAT
jgi:hypothetical protein